MNRATAEITMLERVSTTSVAKPIPIPFSADVVVPSVGHIPSTSTKVGMSFIIPFLMRSIGVIRSSFAVLRRSC